MLEFPILEIPRTELGPRFNFSPEVALHARHLVVQGRPESFALLDELPRQGLAIVGTRTPQRHAVALVHQWVAAWSASDRIILSGLAQGIDTAAHEAAIAAGLPTIAFLATGLARIYPPQNEPLARRIVEKGGLLVSEEVHIPDVKPHFFLERNRWIAAFSSAAWIVQAADRSGALNTATWAARFDRDVYVTPAFPGDATFAGNQKIFERPGTHALWAPHHLGRTWLDLVGTGLAPRRKGQVLQLRLGLDKPGTEDTHVLRDQIARISAAQGGASAGHLVLWSGQAGWDTGRLFGALQRLLETGDVTRGAGGIFFA